MWCSSGVLPSCRGGSDFAEEHVDGAGEEPTPALAPRVVGVLLADQSREDRGPQVRRVGVGDAEAVQGPVQSLDGLEGGGVGGGARREAGDGSLVHQRVPLRVPCHRVEPGGRDGQQRRARVCGEGRLERRGGRVELLPRLAEHGIDDGELGVEVSIQRGRAHAHSLRDTALGESGPAGLTHHRPRGVEDLVPRALTTTSRPIDVRFS